MTNPPHKRKLTLDDDDDLPDHEALTTALSTLFPDANDLFCGMAARHARVLMDFINRHFPDHSEEDRIAGVLEVANLITAAASIAYTKCPGCTAKPLVERFHGPIESPNEGDEDDLHPLNIPGAPAHVHISRVFRTDNESDLRMIPRTAHTQDLPEEKVAALSEKIGKLMDLVDLDFIRTRPDITLIDVGASGVYAQTVLLRTLVSNIPPDIDVHNIVVFFEGANARPLTDSEKDTVERSRTMMGTSGMTQAVKPPPESIH